MRIPFNASQGLATSWKILIRDNACRIEAVIVAKGRLVVPISRHGTSDEKSRGQRKSRNSAGEQMNEWERSKTHRKGR